MKLTWATLGKAVLILVTMPIWVPGLIVGGVVKLFLIGFQTGLDLFSNE